MEKKKFGRITFIPGPARGRYPYCNSLYIDDEKQAVVDAGSDEGVLRTLIMVKPMDMIINSHYHEDHIAFNFLFPEAELCVHENEAPCYESLRLVLDYYGLLGTEYEQAWRDVIVNKFNYKERKPSVEFRDGDQLNFGQTTMQVIHTPGHSIGHCSFYFPEERLLYLGDLDMTGFGPWYGDRVSDIDATIESVRRLMTIPARTFVSAHEAGIIEGDISPWAEAYLAVIAEREEKVWNCLERPKTLPEIAGQWLIYRRPREPKYLFEFAERALIHKHLERLEKKGRVKRNSALYCRS